VLSVVLWKWKQANHARAYSSEHVDAVARMLHRNIRVPHRIICITDEPEGISECETYPLWGDADGLNNATNANLPSCYRRLKLYDQPTQELLGIRYGDRIVGIDLDTVITGDVTELFTQPTLYTGWVLRGKHHPQVYNGSLQIFDAGPDLQHIWSEFDPATSPLEAFRAGYLGSDQSWLSYKLIGRVGAHGASWPEVASYPLQVRLQGVLSAQTKIVFFHGMKKPWDAEVQHQAPWVNRYWR